MLDLNKEKRSEDNQGAESSRDLLKEMREKAEAEKREILKAADARIREIDERAGREVDRIKREAVAKAEAELVSARDRVTGEARSDLRANRLELKRAQMESVLAAARSELEGRVGGPTYETALESLIREGVEFVGPGCRLIVSDADVQMCKKLIASLKLDCIAEGGGAARGDLLAISKDGKRSARNGLATRLERVESTIAAEVAHILFG